VQTFAGLLGASSSSFFSPPLTGLDARCSILQQKQVQRLHTLHFLKYVMHRQEILIMAASAHHSATLFLPGIAAVRTRSGFPEVMYSKNWLSSWVEQESVQYDWKQAGPIKTYVVSFSSSSVWMCCVK
jgi:hypothetical protein